MLQTQIDEAPKNVGCIICLSIMQLLSGVIMFASTFIDYGYGTDYSGAIWYSLVDIPIILTGILGLVSACNGNRSKGL